MPALQRGDVVALRRGRTGIVWKVEGDVLSIIPVAGCNGPPRHRAEVRIESLAEVVACGVSIKHPVVRCHEMFAISRGQIDGQEPIGCATVILIAKIIATLSREAEARATEARYAFMQAVAASRGAIVLG